MGKKLVFTAALFFSASAAVAGCILCLDEYSNGGRRDIGAMSAWAKRIREECKIVGHGIDISKDWNRTDILQCPDGSINVVPDGIGT